LQVFRGQLSEDLKDCFDHIEATLSKAFALGKIFSTRQLQYLNYYQSMEQQWAETVEELREKKTALVTLTHERRE
jgi:hypothetical protein